MNAFVQSWKDRAFTRGVGMNFFKPPADTHLRLWHIVNTHLGPKRVQWRPGIDVWHGEEGERWTAEFGHEAGWIYVEVAANQTGGRK